MYICPLCQSGLTRTDHGMGCVKGHQFDRAKEGYLHLLPVQHKGSKQPGDSAEMITARRQFLEQGYYQPLRDRCASQLQAALDKQPASAVLDLGCGEGYYSAAFATDNTRVYGLDISKFAIRAAAKRYSNLELCVASGHRLPFSDNSFDAVVRIYAPSKQEELRRVIKPGGYLLTVTPGPRHLCQYKALIYSQVHLHPERAPPAEPFKPVSETSLSFSMRLTSEHAVQLLQMTPFAWRASSEAWQWLAATDLFECEADFCLRLWQKSAD